MSVEKHLAKFGVTVQQAKDFIKSNAQQPENIFDIAFDNGVTTEMLSELSGYSIDIVREYFDAAKLNSIKLDYTKLLINSDLNSLESLITTNVRSGLLSNTSLQELVLSKIEDPLDYEAFFEPFKDFQDDDGIYDVDELGVNNLTSIPATAESLKSIFYGSLINIYSRLDDAELNQINQFPNKESSEYQSFLLSALNSPSTISRNDTNLSTLIMNEASNIINQYWTGLDPDTGNVDYRTGIFDFSLLGNI